MLPHPCVHSQLQDFEEQMIAAAKAACAHASKLHVSPLLQSLLEVKRYWELWEFPQNLGHPPEHASRLPVLSGWLQGIHCELPWRLWYQCWWSWRPSIWRTKAAFICGAGYPYAAQDLALEKLGPFGFVNLCYKDLCHLCGLIRNTS